MAKATTMEEYKHRSRVMGTTMAKEYERRLLGLSVAQKKAKRVGNDPMEVKFAFIEWCDENVLSNQDGIVTFKDGSKIQWK